MSISNDIRHAVRERYHFACGYCGISEIDVGSELEIDHFQPIRSGGTDEWDNLVYACPACNRNKASYWPSVDAEPQRHLLHPLTDDLNSHLTLSQEGYLVGLTPRGCFHIEWLHLNRPQLIMMRQRRAIYQRTQKMVEELQQVNRKILERIALQEEELYALRQEVRRLMGDNSER
ncbi:MAG: HNH endonuclease signature motif containing protein [Candidatus Parabeggiatoa sp.]|nr:HNH endonuclease signature motif containing protein [Candidatus Parabeggiatoa sp.]